MKQEETDKIESELKKRWDVPYEWGRMQNDVWDEHSSFIYNTPNWEVLIRKCEDAVRSNGLNKKQFFNYTFNRWYNYWSAVAVEKIFTAIPGIVSEIDKKHRLVDFNFFGRNFDLKTSVFPKGFGKDLKYCREHPKEMILWLYKNQSAQQRQHYANRLFLIVFSEAGNHWKLKAEISWLKQTVTDYVANFDHSQLHIFKFDNQKTTFSDIIWAIK